MIQHTVVFRLNVDADADRFIARARELAAIDGVRDFEVLHQVGKKNDYSALTQRTRDTAGTGAADRSTLCGLQSTSDSSTGGLKPLTFGSASTRSQNMSENLWYSRLCRDDQQPKA